MLLTVLCSLTGAYLGLSGRNPLTAALIASALTAAAHYVVVYATAFLVAFAPNVSVARQLLSRLGVTGSELNALIVAAAGAALFASVLSRIVSPPEREPVTV